MAAGFSRCRWTGRSCCCIRRAPDRRARCRTRTCPGSIAAWLPDSRHIVMFGQPQGNLCAAMCRTSTAAPHARSRRQTSERTFSAGGPCRCRRTAAGLWRETARASAIYRSATARQSQCRGWWPTMCRSVERGRRGALRGARHGVAWVIHRTNIATGRRTHLVDIRARDGAGLRLSMLNITPDGKYYVHSFSRLLTDLFVVDGLKVERVQSLTHQAL